MIKIDEYTGNWSPALNHGHYPEITEGATVHVAIEPDGREWSDFSLALQASGLRLDFSSYDEETGMDEYTTVSA